MHFYERGKRNFVYIFLFVLARRFYRFLKNFPNVGYDILERGYRYNEVATLRVSYHCDVFMNVCLVRLGYDALN